MAASMKIVAGRLSHKLLSIRLPLARCICPFSAQSEVQETEDVTYPPIKPKYPPGSWSEDLPRHRIWRHYEQGEKLLQIADVRERLEFVSGSEPRDMNVVQSWDKYPNTLEYKRFITRSNVINGLPDIYQNLDVEQEYKKLKPLLVDALLQEHEYSYQYLIEKRKLPPQRSAVYRSRRLIQVIINTILRASTQSHRHLHRAQYDTDVRLETYWRLTGFKDIVVPHSLGRVWMQYKGKRVHQIRTELPLPEYVPMDDSICSGGDMPVIDYAPIACGQGRTKDRPITMAGHWIGDPCEFIHLSVEVLGGRYHHFMRKYGHDEKIMNGAWTQCGLMSGFASCMAQAYNLGFDIYHDVTYPITTQTVITDGRLLQFFAYQLNTMHLWQTRDANPRNNLVWVGERRPLYEDIRDGELRGINDEAFIDLLKFIILETVDRGYELRPYILEEHSPANKRIFINNKGEEPLPYVKIGRFQYPRNAVYF